jgi:hypothetical protein
VPRVSPFIYFPFENARGELNSFLVIWLPRIGRSKRCRLWFVLSIVRGLSYALGFTPRAHVMCICASAVPHCSMLLNCQFVRFAFVLVSLRNDRVDFPGQQNEWYTIALV